MSYNCYKIPLVSCKGKSLYGLILVVNIIANIVDIKIYNSNFFEEISWKLGSATDHGQEFIMLYHDEIIGTVIGRPISSVEENAGEFYEVVCLKTI